MNITILQCAGFFALTDGYIVLRPTNSNFNKRGLIFVSITISCNVDWILFCYCIYYLLLHFVAQCDFNGISTEDFNDCHLILDGDNSTYKVLEGGEGVSIISHTLEIDPNCVETNEARKNQYVSSLSFSRSRVSH